MADALFNPDPQPEPEPQPERVRYPRAMLCATLIRTSKRRVCGHPFHAHMGTGPCIHAHEKLAGSVCPCLHFTPSARA